MPEKDVKSTRQESQRPRSKDGQYLEVYTPVQLHFLGRLERLISIKNSYRDHPSKDKWLEQAVDRCIYTFLRDCIEQGIGEEAKAMLRRQQWTN